MTQVPPITIQYGLLQLPEGAKSIEVTQWTIKFSLPDGGGEMDYRVTMMETKYFRIAYDGMGKSYYLTHTPSFEDAIDAIESHYKKTLADLAECG